MTPEAIKRFCKAVAVMCVTTGAFGSLACVPYAIGMDWLLVGIAGVYFVAGAVLIAGGLIAYTLLITRE